MPKGRLGGFSNGLSWGKTREHDNRSPSIYISTMKREAASNILQKFELVISHWYNCSPVFGNYVCDGYGLQPRGSSHSRRIFDFSSSVQRIHPSSSLQAPSLRSHGLIFIPTRRCTYQVPPRLRFDFLGAFCCCGGRAEEGCTESLLDFRRSRGD